MVREGVGVWVGDVRISSGVDRRRLWRAVGGIVLAVVVAVALVGFGAVVAIAVTSSGGEDSFGAPSDATTFGVSWPRDAGATVTVMRGGKPVRVVRLRTIAGSGRTIQSSVTLPSRTVRESAIVTTREVSTVTAVQTVTVTAPPETVTLVETVTCAPPGNC
jgi:hypothetical protein